MEIFNVGETPRYPPSVSETDLQAYLSSAHRDRSLACLHRINDSTFFLYFTGNSPQRWVGTLEELLPIIAEFLALPVWNGEHYQRGTGHLFGTSTDSPQLRKRVIAPTSRATVSTAEINDILKDL